MAIYGPNNHTSSKHVTSEIHEPRPPSHTPRHTIKPPIFSGTLDPQEFLDWVVKMEQYFDYTLMPDTLKVTFTKCLLEEPAKSYWANVERILERNNMPPTMKWDEMIFKLKSKYVPQQKLSSNDGRKIRLESTPPKELRASTKMEAIEPTTITYEHPNHITGNCPTDVTQEPKEITEEELDQDPNLQDIEINGDDYDEDIFNTLGVEADKKELLFPPLEAQYLADTSIQLELDLKKDLGPNLDPTEPTLDNEQYETFNLPKESELGLKSAKELGCKPTSSPLTEPLGLLPLNPKESLCDPLELSQPLDPILDLGDSLLIPIGTQTLEELPTLLEIDLNSPEYELGFTLELPKLGHDPNSPNIEVLNTETLSLAELKPELECFNFIIPDTPLGVNLSKHLVLDLDNNSTLGTQDLEDTPISPKLDPSPSKKDLELNLDPFEFPHLGLDLDPNPVNQLHPIGSLAPHPLNYRSCFLGPTPKTPRITKNNPVISPLHAIKHIDFIIPDHFNSTRNLQPKYTNKVGRERKFTVGTPQEHMTWNWSKDIDCCDADNADSSDIWDSTLSVEYPPPFEPPSTPYLDHNHEHRIEAILEDQTQFTLDKVQLSYLVKYVDGDEGWIPEEELIMATPDLLTRYKGNSPEENFSHPGRADVGGRHALRRIKWNLRPP